MVTLSLFSKHFLIVYKKFYQGSNDEKINYILELGAGNAELARDLILYLKKEEMSTKDIFS